MEKQNNFKSNFSFSGYTSIFIGFYFILAAYFIKKMFDSFLIDNHPLNALSPEILEILVLIIIFLGLTMSFATLFSNGKSKAKSLSTKLWNKTSKVFFWKYLISLVVTIFVIFFVISINYLEYVAPTFLMLHALILLLLHPKINKNILILSGTAIFLAIICFLITMYWYSALFILGAAHITYGLIVKE